MSTHMPNKTDESALKDYTTLPLRDDDHMREETRDTAASKYAASL